MTNEIKDYTDNQRIMFSLHEIDFFIEELYNDKKRYKKYCEGNLQNASEEKIQEMQVLSLLEKLGYPMDEMGTYLYKNMVIKISNHLKEVKSQKEISDCKNLILDLKDGFSQFYLDVARNDLDIGVKTFHKCLERAISKIDYSKADPILIWKVYGNVNEEMDYGEHAFIIGAYVSGIINQPQYEISKNIPKIKKLINVPENNE